jgi:hypothetical protein
MFSVSADKLRELLSRMDQRDDGAAVLAMRETLQLLQLHGLSFRGLVEQIEVWRLLLPSRIGTAIMMMDSTTANECESAFGAVRKMMQGCGLSFARIGEALNHKKVDVAEFEKVRAELQVQADNARRLQRQVETLRAKSGASQAASGVSQPRAFGSSLLTNGIAVFGVGFALAWFVDVTWFGNAGPLPTTRAEASVIQSVHPLVPRDPGLAVAMPPLRHDARSAGPPVRVNVPVHQEPSGRGHYDPGYDCWRDRNIRGGCFSRQPQD